MLTFLPTPAQEYTLFEARTLIQASLVSNKNDGGAGTGYHRGNREEFWKGVGVLFFPTKEKFPLPART